MSQFRITQHPVLSVPDRQEISFLWEGARLTAQAGEVISSALFAHGVRIFGRHPRDGAPQGMFCANGQCSQCLVIADGRPVKACMTPVSPGMDVRPLSGLPVLPSAQGQPRLGTVERIRIPVLILGGGPAGMSAAIQLGRFGIDTILVDDKDRLGGKLVLQTHRFFGSINAVYAGTRGIDIATRLEAQVREFPSLQVWLNTTVLSVFSDGVVGVFRTFPAVAIDGEGSEYQPGAEGRFERDRYVLVEPEVLLVATGAREKSLIFRGNTLPGVYGAGAFQTLVNRDLVRAASRLFIIGGGNVGLIAGYHALQAGIEVVGLVEALPECGGYKVHKDKLVRFGVPIYTRHTILSANGTDQVESATIARLDDEWRPVPGTEQSFACDTVLIAVGLDPVNEFTIKAREFGMTVLDTGDAEEIAEASAAMFSGKIRGQEIARLLGATRDEVPREWYRTAEILKSHPGQITAESIPDGEEGVIPVIHCSQEIPCNPCTSVCPQHLIEIDPDDIRSVPEFVGKKVDKHCIACEKCVTICPALAITLVDYRKDPEFPTVTLAYEFNRESLQVGDRVTVLDTVGGVVGEVEVVGVRATRASDHTAVVKIRVPRDIAKLVAGIQVQESWVSETLEEQVTHIDDDEIVCRCERVSAGEMRDLIRKGYRDLNEIKAVVRAQMGACGGKTCGPLLLRLFREQGVPLSEVTRNIPRPPFMETPMGVLAGLVGWDDDNG